MKVKGDFSKQYSLLGDYVLELQRTNEDTTMKIDLERDYNLRLKDLLGLDGYFMKGQYPGQLLLAVAIDVNHGIYHGSYAIVEPENTSSWSWFLTCLGDDLDLNPMSNFTFISNRQKGILSAIAQVFPKAEHRFCVRHIYENFKAQWKGNQFTKLVWKCAAATNVPYFDKQMGKLKNLDKDAYEYLQKIPSQHWLKSHFSGRAHCDVLLNNLCEVFNRQLVDGRDVPIITCLEFIREYLVKIIVNVKNVISKSPSPLTPATTKLFEAIKYKPTFYTVLWNGGTKYQASGPYED
uniref:MULE transposase domain-containing protein n=1 Tax=Tanacetum cinerariifolium TaxID=118510 RepID=A0A699GLL6_TANCI|nr:hypothetical protein [Tanacetum cinerariifolium]